MWEGKVSGSEGRPGRPPTDGGVAARIGTSADVLAATSVRMCAAYSQARPFRASAAIVVALGGAWAGCLAMGGSHNAGTHLFYIAIVLAAVRFTWRATAVVAVAAGALGGPLLPADLSMGLAQQPDEWIPRLALFVVIGVLVALLVENPEATLRGRLLDAMASARLLRALKRGEIDVFYQPICRVEDGRITGLEALARWRGSDGGYVSPGMFIPPAERTGAIAHLDEYVLQRAIAAACGWQSDAQPLHVSVNLSASTLAQPRLVDMIDRILRDAGLPPHLLQLEVTESAAIDDLPGAVRQLAALRARGVKVAVDDFGAGQASISYLQNLPVDVVKIDRCIVSAATSDDRGRRLLEGVSHMCDLLGLQVVAEGVELTEQLACLRQIGVPMAQGYLLGRPAPAGEIHALLDVGALR